ncbi:MAG: class II fructose-bisphosphate aldolase [Vicinamibacterales bacterium]|nr:class II fructose-bisphosphate aldolase [Vicinamibacterales bacterium]
MPVASLPEIMDRAFRKRYGVAAFNTVDDITMHGVIKAAEQSKSPLIIQISVKTVKFWGAKVVKDMFTEMAGRATVPVTLHLDHCPDPQVARSCLEVGWNSVLFDGSGLSFDENFQHTREIVKFASQFGASVEGEVVAVAGVEDGMGSESEGDLLPIERELDFIKETGIYCYAPPIGTAHGFYKAAPTIRYDRMQQLVEATGMPMVLHGGTGLTHDVYTRLIALGAAKVNISTQLKKTYADGFRTYLEKNPSQYDPLKLIGAVQNDVTAMARGLFTIFGSEGQA